MPRILIIDDHEVVRDGVKKILTGLSGQLTFGEAGTVPEALGLASREDWDAAVLDLSMAGRSGLELLKQLKQLKPKLAVLVLSMHSEEQYARRAFKAGAAGYVTKDSPREEILRAAGKVLEGGRHVSPELAEKLVMDWGRGTEGPPHEALSDRELEVMSLIASGKTVGTIAKLLFLSDKTVSTYRARILEKMNMKTNAELTHYAIRDKLVE